MFLIHFLLYLCRNKLKQIIMGRYSIEEQDVKKSFGASAKQKVIDLVGKRKCKDIAENAVNKEYEKLLKKQGK